MLYHTKKLAMIILNTDSFSTFPYLYVFILRKQK